MIIGASGPTGRHNGGIIHEGLATMSTFSQTEFSALALGSSDLGVDAGCRDSTAAPALYPESQAQRGVNLSALDVAQPAPTLGTEAKRDRALFKSERPGRPVNSEGHGMRYSDHLNNPSTRHFQTISTDVQAAFSHDLNMAAPLHDWYLRDWFATMGLKQRDLVTKLDYQPALAHALWHSLQRYRRDHINDVSALLNIAPYELLMPPEEAMALRRLRSAIAEVAKTEPPSTQDAGEASKTGTVG